jgi:hypothetical protein
MKKITTVFAFMLLAIAFTSCDSATSDAKKMAQLTCKIKELSKDGGYKTNEDEITKLSREAEDLSDKYKKKYKDMKEGDKEELQKKILRAYQDELKKCDDKKSK